MKVNSKIADVLCFMGVLPEPFIDTISVCNPSAYILALLRLRSVERTQRRFLRENQLSKIVMNSLEKIVVGAMRVVSKICKVGYIVSPVLLFFRGPISAIVMFICFAFLHVVYRDLAVQMEEEYLFDVNE